MGFTRLVVKVTAIIVAVNITCWAVDKAFDSTGGTE